jgi:hypothetical protein
VSLAFTVITAPATVSTFQVSVLSDETLAALSPVKPVAVKTTHCGLSADVVEFPAVEVKSMTNGTELLAVTSAGMAVNVPAIAASAGLAMAKRPAAIMRTASNLPIPPRLVVLLPDPKWRMKTSSPRS